MQSVLGVVSFVLFFSKGILSGRSNNKRKKYKEGEKSLPGIDRGLLTSI